MPRAGHVDPGEDERVAAFRETEEEAGLAASQLRIHPSFSFNLTYDLRKGPKQTLYFLAELPTKENKVTPPLESWHLE